MSSKEGSPEENQQEHHRRDNGAEEDQSSAPIVAEARFIQTQMADLERRYQELEDRVQAMERIRDQVQETINHAMEQEALIRRERSKDEPKKEDKRN
ncbi:hypothetical protein FQN55_002984 [Onygenales sp. PD_40]|nr:hypothetical protein FQN55_002984 [Onygenales sp. PD_40]KAK2793783.1 hypothetical protein FQN52_000735 [Onygenales sp. PD_12]